MSILVVVLVVLGLLLVDWVMGLALGIMVTMWYGRLWSVEPVTLSVRLRLVLLAVTSSASMWLAVDLLCLLRSRLTPRVTLWAWAPGTLTTTVLLNGACCALVRCWSGPDFTRWNDRSVVG